MGFLSRLRTGWALAMDSLQVLREEPSLTVFPAAAGVSGATFLLFVYGWVALAPGTASAPAVIVAMAVAYLLTAIAAAFFSGALTWNAREVLRGRDPTLKDGLRAAWRNKWPLIAWGVIVAVVGMALRLLERSDNLIARIAAFFFSVAWGILTYFVVPVVVFEEVSVRAMFERSGHLFKTTWGETIGAGFGVGIVTVLFTLAGLGGAVIVYFVLGGSGLGVLGGLLFGALVVLVAVLGGTTLGAVAKVALYVFATEGTQPAAFDDIDFERAIS